MSLSEETLSLQRAAHDLMYLGMDGSPVYSDDLSRRNGEVYRMTTALYNSGFKGSTVEEQANVCLALLMGYNASFIDHGEKQEHIQEILNRCWDILEVLPASLLNFVCLLLAMVKFMMSLWLMKHVKLLLVGLQLHSLPTIRKPLKSFRMWWITLIHGNMWINKTLL